MRGSRMNRRTTIRIFYQQCASQDFIIMNQLPESYTGDVIPELKMSLGYKLLFWIIAFLMLGLTVWVWFIAFSIGPILERGEYFPIDDFSRLLMGYHILLLLVSIIGWIMQITWQKMRILALFPLAMVVGVVTLMIAALKLSLVYYFFGG